MFPGNSSYFIVFSVQFRNFTTPCFLNTPDFSTAVRNMASSNYQCCFNILEQSYMSSATVARHARYPVPLTASIFFVTSFTTRLLKCEKIESLHLSTLITSKFSNKIVNVEKITPHGNLTRGIRDGYMSFSIL